MERIGIKIKLIFSALNLKKSGNSNLEFALKFFLKVTVSYVVLSYLVDAYIALVDPQGRFDFSETLGKVNLIVIMRDSILYASAWLLHLLCYKTFITTYCVGITGSGGVQIGYTCIGIKALITLILLVSFFPAGKKNKIYFLLISLPIMHFLNIIRITTLAILNKLSYLAFIEHHDVFDIVIYTYIAISFYFFVSHFSDYKIA